MALRTFSLLSRRYGWGAALRGGTGTSICLLRAGQALRITRGRDRSGNRDMPLHDVSDFHFADGSPAEITPTQQKWMKERETLRLRQEKIESEMVVLHSFWEEKDRQAEEQLEKQKEAHKQAEVERNKKIREIADKNRKEILARNEADRKKREIESQSELPVDILLKRQRRALQEQVEKNFREGKPKVTIKIKKVREDGTEEEVEEEIPQTKTDDDTDMSFITDDSDSKDSPKKKKKKSKGVAAPISPKINTSDN